MSGRSTRGLFADKAAVQTASVVIIIIIIIIIVVVVVVVVFIANFTILYSYCISTSATGIPC